MRSVYNKRIFAFITNRCNNRCEYCFVYNGKETYDMSLDEFTDLCKEGVGKFEYLTFIGGEPLLHPHLEELMKVALGFNYKISISTSGIQSYNQTTENIFSLPIDDVTLSLDSHKKSTNDLLRGKGSFERVIETASFLKKKKIEFRVTSTICRTNKDDIFNLADFIHSLGASQLDLHVMSQKGRATNRQDLSLEPQEWITIRRKLDNSKYSYPFHISYPIMWCEKQEKNDYCSFCDAAMGNRLSVMPNGDCYYCTIAIGLPQYMVHLENDPINSCPKLYKKDENLCDIEKNIATTDGGYDYICRFVKKRTEFTN